MKNILFLAIVFFAIQTLSAQESKEVSNENIYNTAGVDVKPEFIGGMQEFYNFIGNNFRVPNVKGLAGKIYVSFIIEKDGSVEDIKVIRDIGHGTGKEAKRILKICPKWKAGEQNGRKVRVLYTLPIIIQTEK